MVFCVYVGGCGAGACDCGGGWEIMEVSSSSIVKLRYVSIETRRSKLWRWGLRRSLRGAACATARYLCLWLGAPSIFQCETGGTRTDRERHLYPILLIYKRTTMVQETRTEVRLKLGVLGIETGNELVYLIFVNKAIVSLWEGTESR